jgi:hypothetical protein
MSALRRRAARLALAGVAVCAALPAPAEDGAAARQPAARQQAAAPEPAHVELERLKHRADAAAKAPADAAKGDVTNAFSSTSWYVPPPPVKPPPPPKPTAPPLPFTFMGRYDDANKAVVMLVKGDRLYTVSEGDVIDGTYRVDRISDKSVELMYLPLHEKQTLSAGGA